MGHDELRQRREPDKDLHKCGYLCTSVFATSINVPDLLAVDKEIRLTLAPVTYQILRVASSSAAPRFR